MPNCGTRYRLLVRPIGQPDRKRLVVALYTEDREPDSWGRPGKVLSRRLVHALVDGCPAWGTYRTLEDVIGGPFVVIEHSRADGPRWSDG